MIDNLPALIRAVEAIRKLRDEKVGMAKQSARLLKEEFGGSTVKEWKRKLKLLQDKKYAMARRNVREKKKVEKLYRKELREVGYGRGDSH